MLWYGVRRPHMLLLGSSGVPPPGGTAAPGETTLSPPRGAQWGAAQCPYVGEEEILRCIVLYCVVLCCVVSYCVVLYCLVLCCIVLYCVVLCCVALCCIVLGMDFSTKGNRGWRRDSASRSYTPGRAVPARGAHPLAYGAAGSRHEAPTRRHTGRRCSSCSGALWA